MYAAAEANGVMMQEGMWSRFFPATEHARTLIEQGAIGDVKVFQGDFGFSGMGQSAEDMEAKRAIHNPSMSCCESLARPRPSDLRASSEFIFHARPAAAPRIAALALAALRGLALTSPCGSCSTIQQVPPAAHCAPNQHVPPCCGAVRPSPLPPPPNT